MAATLHLKVMTPASTVLEQDVDFVVVRALDGDYGILPGHQRCTLALSYGLLHAHRKNAVEELMLLGGIAQVSGDSVVVLSEVAAHPDEIKKLQERVAKERAEKAERNRAADLDTSRAEKALRRALVRMDNSSYSIIKGKNENS